MSAKIEGNAAGDRLILSVGAEEAMVIDSTTKSITGVNGYSLGSSSSGDAADISFTPSGDIAAANVQAAIEELDGEKASVDGSNASGTWPISISGAAESAERNVADTMFICGDINASTDTTSNGSIMIQNVGGTGDSALASASFHCQGNYGIKQHLRPDGFFGIGGWSSAAWRWYSGANGDMVASGNVSAYSDPRLKENFVRIDRPFDILNALDGGTFNWKHGIPHTEVKWGKRDYGVLADQVQAVMPEIISESVEISGEVYLAVCYEKLVPVLIEAVKELKIEIEQLRADMGL